MGIIWTIIIIVWILSLVVGLFALAFWKGFEEEWARDTLIICLFFFIGIPALLLLGFAIGIAEWFGQGIENMAN